jgi:hypothetical protein
MSLTDQAITLAIIQSIEHILASENQMLQKVISKIILFNIKLSQSKRKLKSKFRFRLLQSTSN